MISGDIDLCLKVLSCSTMMACCWGSHAGNDCIFAFGIMLYDSLSLWMRLCVELGCVANEASKIKACVSDRHVKTLVAELLR